MPRAGLSADVITEAAAALADEVGYEHLTLAALAPRFGVTQPSLYKHVAGVDELRRLLAVHATKRLGEALARAAVGKARADALRATAEAYRAFARRHPGQYAATVRAPDPADAAHLAAAADVLATVNGVLEGYGLRGAALVDAARTVRSALHGFVTLEAAGGFGMPRDVNRSFGWLVASLDRMLSPDQPSPGDGPRPPLDQ